MYIAGSEDIVEASSKESGKRIIFKGLARDARRTYEAVHSRFGQFYGRFYRHGLSFTDTRMAFAGFIGLYGHSAVVSCVGYLLCGFGSYSFC